MATTAAPDTELRPTTLTPDEVEATDIGDYKYGFSKPEDYVFKAQRGLSEQVVRDISEHKNEPEWMLEARPESAAALHRPADA